MDNGKSVFRALKQKDTETFSFGAFGAGADHSCLPLLLSASPDKRLLLFCLSPQIGLFFS